MIICTVISPGLTSN